MYKIVSYKTNGYSVFVVYSWFDLITVTRNLEKDESSLRYSVEKEDEVFGYVGVNPPAFPHRGKWEVATEYPIFRRFFI